MSKHLAMDSAIWNQLMFGKSRQPFEKVDENVDEKFSGKTNEIMDEQFDKDQCQQPLLDNKCPYITHAPVSSVNKLSKILKATSIFATFIFLIHNIWFEFDCSSNFSNKVVSVKNHGGLIDSGYYNSNSTQPKEIIEVSYPFVPKRVYGNPVYSEVLINHTFDSYGHPSLEKFSPPKDIDFNKVVLTLNTSINGVQFDRLAHLYVGGAEIWRTSTIEPGRKPVYSSFKKDVSQYAKLFHEETDILFQLDNLVTENLTGVFHVRLHADFYFSENVHSEIDGHSHLDNSSYLDENYKYFDIRKSADKVIPLVQRNSPLDPPIKVVPSDVFAVTLPKVSHNTTRLKLAVFASGNSDEEFWYTNVLDKFTDRFERDGTILLGHGPLRFINVWIDGKKIASQTPEPIIFTGGFSPALWSPVVGVDAFDLPSIDLDISGLLPLLWDSQDHELRISVDNGLDEIYATTSGIGSDWILSANLLAYENTDILSSSGEILSIDDKTSGFSFGISLPYTSSLLQSAAGLFEAGISTRFVHKLRSGNILNNTLTSHSKAKISSAHIYEKSGKIAKIDHTGHSSKSFILFDNSKHEVIHTTDISFSYPLALISSEVEVKNGLDLDVSLEHGKETVLKINDNVVMDERNFQTGNSQYHLRNSGNYGEGTLDTKFKSIVSGPSRNFVYKRHVEAAGGEITHDKSSFKEISEDHENNQDKDHGKDHGKNHGKHKCGKSRQ